MEGATRNRTLLRAINVRRGMRRADDKPPEDHWKKRFPDLEKTLLDAYYELKGWNANGIPTRGVAADLDLACVAEDLEQRGSSARRTPAVATPEQKRRRRRR